MTRVLDLLVDKEYDSYEEFAEVMNPKKMNETLVMDFISKLKTTDVDREQKLCNLRKEPAAREGEKDGTKEVLGELLDKENNEIPFFFNICWFYRWLLHDGYRYVYGTQCINAVRKFIELIKIPAYVTEKIRWSIAFCDFIVFDKKDEEKIYSEMLIKCSPHNIGINFSEIISSFMIHHLLLRKRMWDKIDALEENLILNYIALVDAHPELETVFGTAIEKDMELVYREFKKREKTKK